MINTICDNNETAKARTAFKATLSKAVKLESTPNNEDKPNDVEIGNYYNSKSRIGGHGMWYKEANKASYNAIVHKQQFYNNANSNSKDGGNKPEGIAEEVSDIRKDQHTLYTPINNESDIIIVDIENDDNKDFELQNQQQQQLPSEPQKIFMNTNMKTLQNQSTICNNERGVVKYNINYSTNADGHVNTFDNVNNNDVDDDDDDDDETEKDDEDDSLASMETLSDNVSIWIDGEKHWVAGIDAKTTCSELIWALLNYHNGQQPSQRESQQQHQHAQTANTTKPSTIMDNIATTVINKTNSNQYEKHELQRQQQQLPKEYDKNILELNLRTSTNEGNSNTSTGNKPNIHNTAHTNNTPTATNSTITASINQSMPTNTKENFKKIQSRTLTASTESSSSSATPIITSLTPFSEITSQPTLLPVTLPPGIATVSQLITEYVIVKQYQHCEEYLDGSTKVFDVLPSRNGSNKKEYELLLRHLGPAPAVYNNNTTPQLSSLISTDKDSGMGSPVGSARSAKFRRRKHKSSQWLAQANTLHPKLPRCTGNERLMKIILAQDETIQRQLSLLREKERQITKIEEEKHRKRERELGKNYLLETYLNGLDEADCCEPQIQDGEEIFIDEPCYRATLNPNIAITPSTRTLATGAVTDKTPLATEALNMMAKHKIKDKEMRKEKKKKRHKENQTKDEEIQAKDFYLKTNKNKDKEKLEKQQRHQHELKAIDGNTIKDSGNEEEIELQVFWLEKIYTLNKQLQKEEEQAAKLHAKVRKHQLRKTQQTQREVQMEIDKLDNNLALQFGDIRKVEANLMQANEQLQKKLFILERLSLEYLQEQQEKEICKKQDDMKASTERQSVKTNTTQNTENPLKNVLLTNLEKSMDLQTFSLSNIKSKEEVIKLEKIIAKPNIDLRPENTKSKEANSTEETVANNLTRTHTKTSALHTSHISSNVTAISINPSVILTSTDGYQHQNNHHNHHQELTIPPAIAEARPNDTESTSCVFIDKNMLSSLHVQNAKTIKKQMFHTQTTAAAASASTASTQLLPLTQTPLITSGFPKRQFQQTIQQHMPMAATFLTSRPQISHQIQETNIVVVQKPSIALASCSSRCLSSTTSLPLSSATASVLKPQYPPTSTSPSPSIMAMNTVDISQLGTLV